MNVTIQETYERFKHMDAFLSDKEVLGDDVQNIILYDLWQAVKSAATNVERTYTHAQLVAVVGGMLDSM